MLINCIRISNKFLVVTFTLLLWLINILIPLASLDTRPRYCKIAFYFHKHLYIILGHYEGNCVRKVLECIAVMDPAEPSCIVYSLLLFDSKIERVSWVHVQISTCLFYIYLDNCYLLVMSSVLRNMSLSILLLSTWSLTDMAYWKDRYKMRLWQVNYWLCLDIAKLSNDFYLGITGYCFHPWCLDEPAGGWAGVRKKFVWALSQKP